MKKTTLIGLPISGLLGLVITLCLFNGSITAQEEVFTTIRKNVNPDAKEFVHELSETQDSLILENNFLFKRVRFLNSTTEKVFEFSPPVFNAKIPLDELPIGRYTVMFYQANRIIVFQLSRILPFNQEQALESDVAMVEVEEFETDIEASAVTFAMNQEDVEEKAEETFKMKSYNLSSVNRNNVQTREDYRRNNLRPNGKSYD